MTAVAPGRSGFPHRGTSFWEPTSHGPFRESYTSVKQSSALRKEAADAPAPHTPMPAERMSAAFPSAPGAPALLQRPVPASGAAMVALEGSAKLPDYHRRQAKAQRTKPALSRARPKPEASITGRTAFGAREGNHQSFFSTTAAIVPAVMKDSFCSGDRRISASVPAPAGGPWNGSGSANGDGAMMRSGH